MKNYKIKAQKIFTLFLVMLLLTTLFPSSIGAVGKEEASELISLVQLTEDVIIELDGAEATILKKGTVLYATELEQGYVVQWSDDTANISIEAVVPVTEELDVAFLEFEIDKIIGYISSDGRIKIADEETEFEIEFMEEVIYPVYEETEETYEILLGNRLFSVEKSSDIAFVSDLEKEIPDESNSDETFSNDNDTEQAIEQEIQGEKSPQATPIHIVPTSITEPKINTNFKTTKYGKYFEVVNEQATVYDNRDKRLVKVGTLVQGETYPIVNDYGNWHRIWFGDHYGYVHKQDTIAGKSGAIKNLNHSYKQSVEKFTATSDTVVYDNSSGKLVPFAEIEKGKIFPIVSDYGNWYRVIVAERIGYVRKSDVHGYFNKNSKYFEVTADSLPIYDNRTGKLVKVGEVKKGQVYERVSDYGNWHRIQFGNYYGYVPKSGTLANFRNKVPNLNSGYKQTATHFTTNKKAVVYDNTSGKLVPFAEIEKGKSYPISTSYGNWYRIIVANKVGYIHKEDVNVPFTKNDRYFKVTETNLPIYDNRSGKLVKVGTLQKGQTYQRVSDYGNWHRIQFGDYYGYVRKSGTEVSLSSMYRNRAKTNHNIGFLTPKVNVTVYDNTSGQLVPFGTIDKGKKFAVVKDFGNWYEVNLAGRYGYVRKSEVTANVMVAKNIVNPNRVYTYEDLRTDIIQLEKTYPGLISWQSIGTSIDGRNIYAIKLGKGKKEITINGAHHAREWLTTNLLMEMIDVYSQSYANNISYDGYNVRKILDEVSIWFIPMVNPDGVTLVQKGAFSAKSPATVIRLNNGSKDFKGWKANIRGVDLNRQYPAGWNTIRNSPSGPASSHYKGKFALSEPEAKALYDFTRAHQFKTAVAYHSSGEIIYWDYKLSGSLKTLTRRIANQMSAKTGYALVFPGSNPSGGGYTDWFLESIKRPGFTPEISPYVGNRPVPVSSFHSIWKKNDSIGLMLAQEAATR